MRHTNAVRQIEAKSRVSWWPALICLFLVLGVWVVFGQTLNHEFVNYDDPQYVYENPAVTQGLKLSGVIRAFTHFDGEEWWPLTAVSHMLACELYGLKPGGHHFTNVLLHAATAVLLFLVLRKITGALWPSAFVAAVFAIHPLRVESVAWVTERKDVLSGLFFILTLGAYARYVLGSSSNRKKADGGGMLDRVSPLASKDYWFALVFFTLGLLAKSMVVTLPFVLLLLDYWPLRRMAPGPGGSSLETRLVRKLVVEKIPFLLLAGGSGLVTILAIDDFGSDIAPSLSWRMGNGLVAYASYLRQMIYPVGLAVLYPHPGTALPLWQVGVSACLILMISAGMLAWGRKRPYLVTGWFWYVGMLVPVIGLLQVGSQSQADRYTYLPQIGLYLLVTWSAMDLCGRWRYGRAALRVAAAMTLSALMVVAHVQTGYWRDSVSLWKRTLACTKRNFSAHYNLAMELAALGRRDEAIQHYEAALDLRPDSAKAHNNLAIVLAGNGKLNEAMSHWQAVLRLKPEFAEANNNLANALAAQQKWEQAIQQYQQSIKLRPDDAKVCYNLGIALVAAGRLDEAIESYQESLRINPGFAEAHNNLGIALAARTRWKEAIAEYELALKIKPDYCEARNNLGAAFAGQGRWPEAVEQLQRALDLAILQGRQGLTEGIRTRLEFYQSKLSQPNGP